MTLVNRTSLGATVDAVNDAMFHGRRLSKADRVEAAQWIASRQDQPGAYAHMFAPTAEDFRLGVRFYTGERIATQAGSSHILGQEACRALILLNVPDRAVNDALGRATEGILARLDPGSSPKAGTYCCGKCSCAYWRHLAVGGLDAQPRRLAAGIKAIKAKRDGQGRWRVFPFYYALLALSEIDLPAARQELRYAESAVERSLKQTVKDPAIAERRRLLAERVLARC